MDKQAPPPRITPLPPPRAASPISNEVRDTRAGWDEKYDRMYAAEEPEPIEAERKTTELWLNAGGFGARVTRDMVSRTFELEGQSRLDYINPMWTSYIWPNADEVKRLPVHFGAIAKGNLWVSRSASGQFSTHGTNLLLFNHPNLPYLGTPRHTMLLIEIDQSVIKGRVVLATNPQARSFTELDVTGAREILGLDDLHELTTGELTNTLANGSLKVELAQLAYRLQGVFPGTGVFTLADGFTGDAEIEAKGIAPQKLPIRRDTHGALSAFGPLKGTLHARGESIDAKLVATFSRGKFDIDGTLTYSASSTNPSVNGVVKVRLTDLATARDAVRRRLGKYAPPDPEGDVAPNGLALWGEGQVDFRLNTWLTGRAQVVADPDGFVTVIGELRPSAKIEVFEEWTPDLGKYFKAAGELVQLVDMISSTRIGVGGKVNLSATGGIGPGVIEDIEIDGVFSTYPKERLPTQFTIAGTFVVPARVALTLSVGLEISAGGVVGAGIRGKGTATLTARGSVTPKFGLEVPPGGGEPMFFIAGRLTAQALLDLAVSIECYAKIDTPFWSKEVSYPLVDKTFRLGSTSLALQGKYYLGGESKPSDLNYNINTAPGGGHDGFNNQRLSRKAVHQDWDSPGATAPKSTWRPDSYRAAKHVDDVTPSQESSDSAISTQSLAAGGAEAPAIAPEEVPPSPAPVPVAIAAAPSVGGSGSPPPPPPSAPPPPPPPDPSSPVRVELQMLDDRHALVLNREPPASVVIEPAGETLRFALNKAEVALNHLLTRPVTNGGPSTEALSSELSYVERLQGECLAVETHVRALADPFDARAETAGLDILADSLESYGRLYARSNLIDLSATNSRSSTAPPMLPQAYANSTDAVSLEQAEPGRTNRLILDHGRYYATFYTTGRKKPTQTPMDERPYVEMRARFILGMQAETPTIELYNRLMSSTNGVSVEKNNRTVNILDRSGNKERGRRPDFFHVGKVIGDVKNVGTQDYSDQMRDNFRIADADAVSVPAGIAGAAVKPPSKRRTLDATDTTPRIDLIVRVPWHPRGATTVDPGLETALLNRNGTILELIDDPIS